MPQRFAFRQVDYRDVRMFLADGELRSKNHDLPQACHQTSYRNLVEMRGTPAFELPFGGVVNDYVPFYFSPVTAFSYTIHRGNVDVVAPDGRRLGESSLETRAFFVVRVQDAFDARLRCCFSNYALNSRAPMPQVISDPGLLESHVQWQLFDEEPITARIPEIGYAGACRYFNSRAVPERHQARGAARMAEFLIKDAVPIDQVCCIVTPNIEVKAMIDALAQQFRFRGLVVNNPSCFIA